MQTLNSLKKLCVVPTTFVIALIFMPQISLAQSTKVTDQEKFEFFIRCAGTFDYLNRFNPGDEMKVLADKFEAKAKAADPQVTDLDLKNKRALALIQRVKDDAFLKPTHERYAEVYKKYEKCPVVAKYL